MRHPLPATPMRNLLLIGAVLSATCAAALWGIALIEVWPMLLITGEICGAEKSLLGHCAACWPALAATVLAATFALGLASLRLAAPARIRRR